MGCNACHGGWVQVLGHMPWGEGWGASQWARGLLLQALPAEGGAELSTCCIPALGGACCTPSPQLDSPQFLAPACSLQPPLSFSLSLLLSRWPLGGRWMSGVYVLHRWRAGVEGLLWLRGGWAAVCMCPHCMSLPVDPGFLGCPPPASPAEALPPTSVTRS